MKYLKHCLALLGLLTVLSAFPGTVNYTGNGTTARNMDDPANWDGALDDSADLVVDKTVLYAKGATELVFSTDLSVRSLTLTGFSAVDLFVNSGAKTLTLGEGGLVSDAVALCLNCRVVCSASQTWKVSGLATYFTIGGTSDRTLTISQETATANKNIVHRNSPQFPGSLVYHSIYKDSQIWACGNDKWAQNVTCETGAQDYKVFICPNARVRWRNLIPGNYSFGRNFYVHGWTSANGGDDSKLGEGMIVIDDSVSAGFGRTPFNQMGAGIEVATGGTFTPSTDTWMLGQYWSGGNHGLGSRFLVSGGTATVKRFNVGGTAKDNYSKAYDADRVVEVSSGTLTLTYSASVGGTETGYTDAGRNPAPYCQMLVGGGTVNVAPNQSSGKYADEGYGLNIAAYQNKILNWDNYKEMPTTPGVYTQTGGVVTAARVLFGAHAYCEGYGGKNGYLPALYDGFGLFDLRGGTFNLGFGQTFIGFGLGRNWNAAVSKNWTTGAELDDGVGSATGPAVGDSSYKIALAGGTLNVNVAFANTLAMTVPANGAGATLQTETSFVQNAPLAGHGTLRKAGAGLLKLTDACRFRGSLAVAEGAVILAGTNLVADAVSDDCCIWTADDAVQGLAEGDDVTEWTDSTGTYTAVLDDTGDASTGNKAPRAKLNTMNGHAALEFWRSGDTENYTHWNTNAAMIIKSNPLKGCTEFSMVAVLRPHRGGNGDGKTSDGLFASKTVLGTVYGNSAFALQHPGNINNRFCLTATQGNSGLMWVTSGTADDYQFKLDQTSVIIATMSGNKMTLSIDGRRDELTLPGDAADFPRIEGNTMFGICRNTWCGGPQRGFTGDIAEIRIYRNRALSAREENALAYSLLKKYDGSAGRLSDLYVVEAGRGDGGFADDLKPEAAVPEGPVADTVWSASDIVGYGEPGKEPELVAASMGGKDVARFDGTQFARVPKSTSPLSEIGEFTVQVVFRTVFDGVGGKNGDTGLGLVSTKQITDKSRNDFAMTFNRHGAIGCDIGNYNATFGDQKYLSYKPCHLNDGEGHVAVFGFSKSSKKLHRMTDGMYLLSKDSVSSASRSGYDVLIGALTPTNGFFKGDIAEIRVWTRALTRAEMLAASEKAASDYGFRLLAKEAFAADGLAHGLGATNITVAAGAKLLLPRSATAPLTLGAGQSISGEGVVAGTLKLGPGGVLDAAGDVLSKIENLVLAGGTVKIGAANQQTLAVHDLDVAAGGTLRVVGTLADKRSFLVYDSLVGDPSALTVVSDSGRVEVVNDVANKRLIAKPLRGLLLIVR